MKKYSPEHLMSYGILAAAFALALLGGFAWKGTDSPEQKPEVVLFCWALSLLLTFLFLHINRAMRLLRDVETLLKQEKHELEDANRRKSEFMAYLSHELRTPINSIMGFSQLFRDGTLGKLSGMQAEYIDDIYGSSQHLLALVNNILNLSRIEAGKITASLVATDISELLENSISVIKDKIVSKHILLQLDIQPGLEIIEVDILMARQILHNLLSNAVKFTPDGGQLSLVAHHVSRMDVGCVSEDHPARTFPLEDNEFTDFLEISIADSGIGISRAGLEQLFRPYSRIEARTKQKTEGTGLGLVLIKRMAELHGGTVAVESVEGHGSRFIVWLPLQADAEAAQGEEIQWQPSSAPVDFTPKTRTNIGPVPTQRDTSEAPSFAL